MEIFDVFSINGIENVILKVSQTHFSKDFYPKGGHKFFKGAGAVKYPGRTSTFTRGVYTPDETMINFRLSTRRLSTGRLERYKFYSFVVSFKNNSGLMAL